MNHSARRLPIPAHFDPATVGTVWRVPYQKRSVEAAQWAAEHHISPAHEDARRICLLLVDCQNTFCIPEFELFVAGRSGDGAVQDNRRLCEFVYHNLGSITEIVATLDTHTAMQIFHSAFLVNDRGEHPQPMTVISLEDVELGRWRVNPGLKIESPSVQVHSRQSTAQGGEDGGRRSEGRRGSTASITQPLDSGLSMLDLQDHLLHYCRMLSEGGKYQLMVWPYHAMLGGIGHAMVAAVEEACFFHSLARQSKTRFEPKGQNPLTEHYSALRPEVLQGIGGQVIGRSNAALIDHLLGFDALIVAGQAKSHCVAWTVDDLLQEIRSRHPASASKVYLLEDCTSPVVVPGIVDFSESADAAFTRFARAGMHLVRSTEPIDGWLDA